MIQLSHDQLRPGMVMVQPSHDQFRPGMVIVQPKNDQFQLRLVIPKSFHCFGESYDASNSQVSKCQFSKLVHHRNESDSWDKE